MAHQLTVRADGRAEMAYVGAEPWHGLGSKLEPGAPIDTWKKEAGMDWNIDSTPLLYQVADTTYETDRVVLYRNDNNHFLGQTSKKYKIVQPGEVLEFFNDLVGASGFELETAGTLFDGARFWAQASIGASAKIKGMDEVKGYLLLSTSCDGTLPTSVRFITKRVVCNNTLTMALGEKAKREVSISHRCLFNHTNVKLDLGIAVDSFQAFMVQANKLAETQISDDKASQFIATLLAPNRLLVDVVEHNKTHKKIMGLFMGGAKGAELDTAKGTMWGLLNSVTEFTDHHANSKTASNKMNNAWFGVGETLKSKALNLVIAGV